ncbi:MAG: carbohydrate kinase family protein [Bacillota bacterium]
MFDLLALGELLIDFTPAGLSEAGNRLFEENPGGAPANVLAAVAKLGKKSAFIGMVGKDQFGLFLKEALRQNGIETGGLKFSETANTTLAFVHLDAGGDRSFSFYRKPGADMMLTPDDLDYDLLKKARIFHFGSVSMTGEPSRSATLAAAKFAKEHGLMVSYDPNYRPPLWPSLEEARKVIISGLQYADILKVSAEELELITGTNDLAKGSASLHDQGISVVLVTLGPEGCFYRYQGGSGKLAAYEVKVIDTTGAGDAFLGGILYWFSGLSLTEIKRLNQAEFEKMVAFANAMGALSTTKKGAIPAMPSLEEVKQLTRGLPF